MYYHCSCDNTHSLNKLSGILNVKNSVFYAIHCIIDILAVFVKYLVSTSVLLTELGF